MDARRGTGQTSPTKRSISARLSLIKMTYKLFIDDERNSPDNTWVVVRSSDQAMDYIKNNGWPEFISFDHDLGGDDTTIVFLKKLINIWDNNKIPEYKVHSANPVGTKNIISFMKSWKKSQGLGG